MPCIALTNQETTPKILQQAASQKIHHSPSLQGTAAKIYKNLKKQNKTKYKPNLFNPISCTGALYINAACTSQNPVKLLCQPRGKSSGVSFL